ncbi:sulfate permease [Ignavibacteria bacterium]|nr:sulfate permease [Bacteroidota bacterium]MCZ2132812.1 sulfate permease [Bacteroidota bacterium]
MNLQSIAKYFPQLRPKLLTTLQNYDRRQFIGDLNAGVIVGVVALPLAIAFAIASGVSPEKGLFTAIIAGFLISALGGSRVQIGGPTGAFVVIIYGIVQQYGVNGLAIATLLAGAIMVIMGLARLGSLIKFIPHPLITGFTSGIALIIFSSQIKDALGLQMGAVPSDFIEKWAAYAKAISTINWDAAAITIGTVIGILIWQRFIQKIPGSLIALIVTTAVTQIFHLPVETIGSRFGEIPSALPAPSFPHLDWGVIRSMISPAFTIAMLGSIEALLSAVVSDGMIGGRHRSNMELVAQGIANIFSPIFGGIPATGAIARTATNIRNGGRTPVAGIIHSVTLLLIMLFFGVWAKLIPMSCLSGILIIVAYNMSEWRSFRSGLTAPKSDVWIMLITFTLTVFVDLTAAIQIGMLIAVFTFMHRMATVTNVGVITREMTDDVESAGETGNIDLQGVPDGVHVFEINGPFFFGAADKFKEAMHQIGRPPKVRIIRMRNVPALDATGLHVLEETWRESKQRDIVFIISEIHTQPYIALQHSDLFDKIGEENIIPTFDESLEKARQITTHFA